MAQPDYEQPKEGEEILDICPDVIEIKPLDITQDSVLNRPLILGGNLSAAKGTFTSLYANAPDALIIDYGGDILLKHGGSIKFTSVPAPTACTAALITAAGNVDNGTHKYKVTYVTATGETGLGAVSNTVTVDATHKQVALSAIPISASGAVTQRKIYRTKAGGTDYYLLTTINNNSETTYTDNTADASLGVDATNRPNNTFGKIIIDNIICGNFGSSNVFLGKYTGEDNTTGNYNTFIGFAAGDDNSTGYDNVFLGFKAGYWNTTGKRNIFAGVHSGFNNETGNYNTFIGTDAFYTNETGSSNVALGYAAGYYETGSDKLFIDNATRANEADGRIKALIYGVFAAATANQKLTINGLLNLSVSNTPAAANAAGIKGDICWDANYFYVAVDTDTWKRVAIATW